MKDIKLLEKQAKDLQKDLDALKETINKQKKQLPTLNDLKSYLDACDILKEKPVNCSEFDQLKTIIKAANYIDNNYQLWKPNLGTDYLYYPYFRVSYGSLVAFGCSSGVWGLAFSGGFMLN